MPLEPLHPNSPRAVRPAAAKKTGGKEKKAAAAGKKAKKQHGSNKYSPATNLRTQKMIREKAEKKRSLQATSEEDEGSSAPRASPHRLSPNGRAAAARPEPCALSGGWLEAGRPAGRQFLRK